MAQKVTEDHAKTAERLAAIGCTQEEMAHVLGLSVATIRRRFKAQIARGRASMAVSLRRKQWAAAKKGNVTMLIWLGKQYLGQKDRQEVVHGERVEVVEEVVFPEAPAGPEAQADRPTDSEAA